MAVWGRRESAVLTREPEAAQSAKPWGWDEWAFLREQPDHDLDDLLGVSGLETVRITPRVTRAEPPSEDHLSPEARALNDTLRAFRFEDEPRRRRALLMEIVQGDRRMARLVDGEWMLGRTDPVAGIYPDLDLEADTAVSRRHCRIFERDGDYYLQDFRSTNGTCLNGRWLDPYDEVSLRDGDMIQIGDLTYIRVVMIGNEHQPIPQSTTSVLDRALDVGTAAGLLR
jgi:hypothetical protein